MPLSQIPETVDSRADELAQTATHARDEARRYAKLTRNAYTTEVAREHLNRAHRHATDARRAYYAVCSAEVDIRGEVQHELWGGPRGDWPSLAILADHPRVKEAARLARGASSAYDAAARAVVEAMEEVHRREG